jgi:hypothetical protein
MESGEITELRNEVLPLMHFEEAVELKFSLAGFEYSFVFLEPSLRHLPDDDGHDGVHDDGHDRETKGEKDIDPPPILVKGVKENVQSGDKGNANEDGDEI